jgi:hypothetical protein
MPFHQGPVNLFAGIADRAAYSEIWDGPALLPINDGANRNFWVLRHLTL